MPFIDKNYRLFGVINLIDLVVVIALLIGGYAVYRVLGHRGATTASPNSKPVEYTLFIPALREFDASQIHVGDNVATKSDGKSIGKIVSVDATASPIETYDTILHKYVLIPSHYSTDVNIKVETQGVPSGTGVAVGSTTLRNNGVISIITPTFEWGTASIVGLKVQGR